MKEKSSIFKRMTQSIPDDIRREVDLSFAIADRIEALLNERGMTQRDLAKLLGKKESEVSKWLRGTHNFTIQTIAKLSAALGEDILAVQGVKAARQDAYVLFMSLSQSSVLPVSKNGEYDRVACNSSLNDFQSHFYGVSDIN